MLFGCLDKRYNREVAKGLIDRFLEIERAETRRPVKKKVYVSSVILVQHIDIKTTAGRDK